MAKLLKSQINFLEKCGFTTKEVFDASGMQKADYRRLMKELDLFIAYGVSPCKAKGHTMRTRHGHCVQCDTANLGFLKRYEKPGQVYLAWSSKSKWAKIGMANNAPERIKTLNQWKYGGFDDWRLKLSFECSRAGLIENEAHKILAQHSKQGVTYSFGNTTRECRELFECKLRDAVTALKTAVKIDLKIPGEGEIENKSKIKNKNLLFIDEDQTSDLTAKPAPNFIDTSYRNIGVGRRETLSGIQKLKNNNKKSVKVSKIDSTYNNLGVGRKEFVTR